MQGAFEKAYAQLNAAQRKAVDAIDGPVLVIAGPGTGKTQLLTTRIANILDKTDTLPANILCLTFTDSAARTMRERLTGVIGQGAYDVAISTYHGFGSELLRRYPEYFMEASDLQPADDLTIDASFRAILDKLPFSNPLKYDVFLRDVKALVSDCRRALLTPEDVRSIAAANEAFIQAASGQVKELFRDFVRMDKKSAGLFEKLLTVSDALPVQRPVQHVQSLAELWHEQLGSAVENFQRTGKTTELTRWKNAWLAKDEEGHFIVDGKEQVRKLRAAAVIYERYLAELARQQLYDYDDMILQAIKGLETHADLRFTLQERYQYILLDEFQDTNEAQLKIVELLTDNPVNEGRPNVMAVGDDDQAIYAFQGANYSHMLTFAEQYHDTLIVPLTANYRSHPDILRLAHGIAEQIEERLHHRFPHVEKQIHAANKQLPDKSIVARYEFKSDLTQNAWVAKKIAELTAAGTPASEIAVLAPKHEYLEALVPFLRHTGVPIQYERREDVLADETVRALITMSRLVLALSDRDAATTDSLWSHVLSFDFWDLSTELVWRLSWEAHDTGTHWTDVLCSHAETKPIALFFIRLSQLAATEPLERMLDFLIGTSNLEIEQSSYQSPFYERYVQPLLQAEGETQPYWQLLSNLTVVRAGLREYRASELTPLSLRDFINFVEAHRDAELKLLNTNPYQEAAEAVQLMTTFKAKGQEFTAVFLLACVDEVWGSRARNVGSRLSLPPNLQFIRYAAAATEDDRLRLLYVAVTRAKAQLYLVSFETTFAGRLMTRLKYLDEYIDEQGNVTSPLLPVGKQKIQIEEENLPEVSELTVYWQHRHYQALHQPALQELLQPRLKNFQLSASDLNCFTDTSSDGPTTFLTQTLLQFPQAPTVSTAFGNTMHETLLWLHTYAKDAKQLPSFKALIRKFDRQLQAKRLPLETFQLLCERGHGALKAYLEQRSDIILAPNYSEYNFRNEGVFIGEAHLTGKIDKLLVNARDKTLAIVDYKTGRSHTRWVSDIRMHAYKQQLYFYKFLVERSQIFKGYQVADAYLEFVEPESNSGLIRELHLKFDNAEQQALQALIEVVWQHIIHLKLPDISGYTPTAKGIDDFQRDLIEGKL